jgi:hypothetical protein
MLCDAEITIPLEWGSDFDAPTTFTDEGGAAIDLTGGTVYIKAASDRILGHLTVAVDDAAAGLVFLHMRWADLAGGLPLGNTNWFRIGWTDAGGKVTTAPMIKLDII